MIQPIKIKQSSYNTLHIFYLLFILFINGCTQTEVVEYDTTTHSPKEVKTTFNLEVAASKIPVTRSIIFTDQGSTTVDTPSAGEDTAVPDTVQTRSATDLPDAQEKKVAGLWIGQYDASGNWLSNQYIESVTGTQVIAKLIAANNCHIRFVANAGDLGKITTETLLNTKTLTYASTADGKPSSNLFAMTGMWSGEITGNTTAQTITPTVRLTRLEAKITFTYSISKNDLSFTPTAVSLKQVSNLSQIGDPDQNNPVRPTDATYTTSYTGTVSSSGATIYWYLPENMAGTAKEADAVSSEKEKTGTGITNPTFIELFGNAIQNGVEYKNVAFRFYPGKDMNAYNIDRNSHYIMKINLRGLDISDKRITVRDIPPDHDNSGRELAGHGRKQRYTYHLSCWSDMESSATVVAIRYNG